LVLEKALQQSIVNSVSCPHFDCPSNVQPSQSNTTKYGKTASGRQRYKCKTCGRTFSQSANDTGLASSNSMKTRLSIDYRKRNATSSSAWLLYHLILPLVPFSLGAAARCLGSDIVSFETFFAAFSASELALIMAITMFFVIRSLAEEKILDMEVDKKEETAKILLWSFVFSIVSVFLFAFIEYFNTLGDDSPDGAKILTLLERFVFAGFILFLFYINYIQRSFNLRIHSK